jgi:hypothetical protein
MAFTTPTVGARLVHMFGWKTGRWLERRIWDFDRLARKRAVARWIHRPAKGLAHRTVGTAVHASVDATNRDYAETLALLTRIEDMQILLLGTFQPRRDGDVAPHAQLNAGLARAAALRRVRWIDRQEIVAGLGADAVQSNGLYSTPALHRAVADAVITALTAD